MPTDTEQAFNPYASSTHLDIAESSSMSTEKVKRPISVWLMQILLYVFVGLFVIGLFKGMADVVRLGYSNLGSGRVLFSIFWVSGLILGSVWTAISLYRRRNWSKWVCLCLLALLLAVIILSPNTTYYANDAERMGGFVGRYVFFSVLLVWWAYALAFSKKAKRYFKTGTDIDDMTE